MRPKYREIVKSWQQLTQVIFVMTPIIVEKGHAAFEGQAFYLSNEDRGNTFEEKLNRIWQAVPTNVVVFFKNDIFSNKIGPLIHDLFKSELTDL